MNAKKLIELLKRVSQEAQVMTWDPVCHGSRPVTGIISDTDRVSLQTDGDVDYLIVCDAQEPVHG